LRSYPPDGIVVLANKSLPAGVLATGAVDGSWAMLVTMQNSELVGKLVALANGDIDLVQQAIRTISEGGKAAELEKVVDFIVQQRKARMKAA
jgi:hypothetical protein